MREVVAGPRVWSARPAVPWRSAGVWAGRLLPGALYVGLAVLVYRHTVGGFGQRLPGSADGILYAWYLAWLRHCVVHLHNPFFTTAINAPTGVNVMWNTSLLALGLAALPLVMALGPVRATAVLFVAAPAASATTAYVVLSRLTGSRTGATIGGLLFGFAPFFVGHFGHLNLIFAPLLALLLWYAYRLLFAEQAAPRRDGLALGIVLGVQVLVSEELAAFAILAGTVAVAVLAVTQRAGRRPHWRMAGRGLLLAAVTALAVCAVPIAYQLFGPQALRHGLRTGLGHADLATFVRPSVLQAQATPADIAANLRIPGTNGAENTAYLGWPLLILVVGVAGWYALHGQRFARWWLATTLIVAVFSMGSPIGFDGHPVWHGPWTVAHHLPLLGGAQPVRLSLITTLAVAGFLAWFVARFRGLRQAIAAAACVLVLLPLWPRQPYHADSLPSTPRFFTTRAVDTIPRRSTLLLLPIPSFPRVQAMVWQIRAGMRFDIVGGYSVFNVNGHASYFPAIPAALRSLAIGDVSFASRPTVMAALHESHINDVVITGAVSNPARVATVAEQVTGCRARHVADVIVCAVR